MDDRLDMRIKAGAVDTAHRVVPWRPDIAWWIVAIQGVVALVLGMWLLVNQGAGEPVVAVLGVMLLGVASMWGWSAMRSDLPQVVLGWRGLRAGAGIAVGVLVALDFLVDFITAPASLVILAIGLLIVGAIGTAEWVVGRETMGWRWPSLIGSAVAAALGLIVLASRLQAAPIFLQVIAIALIVLGVLLVVRAALLVRQLRLARNAAPGGGGASSASTPVTQASAGAGAPPVTVRSSAASKGGDAGGPGTPGTPGGPGAPAG